MLWKVWDLYVAQAPTMLHAGFSFTVACCPHRCSHRSLSGHGGHAKASWEAQCLFGGWRGDQGTDAWDYHCLTEAATLNWKQYSDRTQEMSVPTHVEDHVALPRSGTRKHGRLLGSICIADAVNSAPKNHAQCDSSRVDPVNVFIFTQTSVVGRAVSSRISCTQ